MPKNVLGIVERILLLIFGLISAIGGLACVLQYLEIKPNTLGAMTTLPHVTWVFGAFILFATSVGFSIFSFLHGTNRLISPLQMLSANDPRIYVGIRQDDLKTSLVLTNRGGSDAHNVEVVEIVMRTTTIKFEAPISVIAPSAGAELTPRCDSFGPAFSSDIVRAMSKEYETYNDMRETISVPVSVTYSDFRGEKLETTCDLVFYAIRDAMKPHFYNDTPSVEFNNFQFRRIA